MINPKELFELMIAKDVNFFSGVPDSLLKDFNAYIMDNMDQNKHIITANEGAAVALAAGSYLATKKISVVYLQNSGLGNAINPLVSLTDYEVYNIPVLLVIGWRGEPGERDEPQHKKQGEITLELLKTLKIPYEVISENTDNIEEKIDIAFKHMVEFNSPYALVIKKNTFEKYNYKNKIKQNFEMSREEAIQIIVKNLDQDNITISTTGMISRELFETRKNMSHEHNKDFLVVGSMGHASQIALGIAISKPKKQVFCLDGDGSTIMHMGGLGIIGSKQVKNFKHIVLNNEAHDSVGGQPTVGNNIDFVSVAMSCKYKNTCSVKTRTDLEEKIKWLKKVEGPGFLEIKVNKGHRKDLGRPSSDLKKNKEAFMEFLSR
jgi:phosphonopyruvate decarboxylase